MKRNCYTVFSCAIGGGYHWLDQTWVFEKQEKAHPLDAPSPKSFCLWNMTIQCMTDGWYQCLDSSTSLLTPHVPSVCAIPATCITTHTTPYCAVTRDTKNLWEISETLLSKRKLCNDRAIIWFKGCSGRMYLAISALRLAWSAMSPSSLGLVLPTRSPFSSGGCSPCNSLCECAHWASRASLPKCLCLVKAVCTKLQLWTP